jgi:hypothetical protein
MRTLEISRGEWAAFFDSFSRRHEGWLATVEVLGEEVGAQTEARELPLVGVSAELKGGEDDAVSIILGGARGDHITHTVTRPDRVRVEQAEGGADEALQIESADGSRTLLRFRSAVLPEMVDGIVSE